MGKVSVVIPTCNRAKFVVEAVESVLRQSVAADEIIVIDDGSTDNTRDLLGAYDQCIRYIYQKNGGVSRARNTGVEHARGDWLAFLDSDDEWEQDYLKDQLERAKKFPNAVAHMTNATIILEDGRRSDYFADRSFRESVAGDLISTGVA